MIFDRAKFIRKTEPTELSKLVEQADNIFETRYKDTRPRFEVGLRKFITIRKFKIGHLSVQVFEEFETGNVLLGEYHSGSWSLEFLADRHLSKEEIQVFLVTERLLGAIDAN
jgi:hypothetical protein